jgi:hypothetical protein
MFLCALGNAHADEQKKQKAIQTQAVKCGSSLRTKQTKSTMKQACDAILAR